jgi:hypothetical protein
MRAMSTLIDKHTGIVKLQPKQGKKPKYKPKDINIKEIEICLTCD